MARPQPELRPFGIGLHNGRCGNRLLVGRAPGCRSRRSSEIGAELAPMNETPTNEELPITRELFLEWRSPRAGNANPSVLTNPVWEWLIRTRMNAYQATQLLGGPSPFDAGPGWCFDRFGQTTTVLTDGREVFVAGEHEDSYDPDFFIYSDVVVRSPNGEVAIYGYSKDVFPPTDFHTATLLKGSIVLIGSLGYQEERRNKKETQVLELMLDSFAIHKIDVLGASPGWIHRHNAALSDDGQRITVFGGMVDPGSAEKSLKENVDDWVLDLGSWAWTRTTDRNWQQWTFRRADRKHGQLWNLRQAVWMRDMQWKEDLAKEMHRLEANIGQTPDLDLIPFLYRPDDSVIQLPEAQYNVFRVLVDDVVVRFTEESRLVRAIVEGRLSHERLQALQESVRSKLSLVDGAAWEIETF